MFRRVFALGKQHTAMNATANCLCREHLRKPTAKFLPCAAAARMESKAPNAFQTSTEARGGPGVQFAVGLGFAMSLQLEIQVTVCHELEFAVCSTVDSLPWV
jgi:hypothetical protein